MKLCEKLYKLRRAAGLSQEELAEKLTVSRQAVSKWENGAAQPELSKLVELSRLYGVSVDELLVPSRFMRKIVCRLRLNEVSRQ